MQWFLPCVRVIGCVLAIWLPKGRLREEKEGMVRIDKVQVWILSGAQVLLLKTVAARGAHWQPVTGWVDPGETAEIAARREVAEETGIELGKAAIEFLGDPVQFMNRGREVREQAFLVRLPSSSLEIQTDPSEHTEWKWADADFALTALPFPQQKQALQLALSLEHARKD